MEMLKKILENEKANEKATERVIYQMIGDLSFIKYPLKNLMSAHYIPCNEQLLGHSEECIAGSASFMNNMDNISQIVKQTGKYRRSAFTPRN